MADAAGLCAVAQRTDGSLAAGRAPTGSLCGLLRRLLTFGPHERGAATAGEAQLSRVASAWQPR